MQQMREKLTAVRALRASQAQCELLTLRRSQGKLLEFPTKPSLNHEEEVSYCRDIRRSESRASRLSITLPAPALEFHDAAMTATPSLPTDPSPATHSLGTFDVQCDRCAEASVLCERYAREDGTPSARCLFCTKRKRRCSHLSPDDWTLATSIDLPAPAPGFGFAHRAGTTTPSMTTCFIPPQFFAPVPVPAAQPAPTWPTTNPTNTRTLLKKTKSDLNSLHMTASDSPPGHVFNSRVRPRVQSTRQLLGSSRDTGNLDRMIEELDAAQSVLSAEAAVIKNMADAVEDVRAGIVVLRSRGSRMKSKQ
ncbi:hypothetical protein FB45DRAFT_1031887 [Roridomyces roridus]|uniref:Uncharacterized protein n=1 Tax=Roridomyces roridus TaxID=1738132 RepID=A0AAD7BII8_9AGAR|nr:hypothetical protein FB45DRAFT_1031887 [Roridomyces roridus]